MYPSKCWRTVHSSEHSSWTKLTCTLVVIVLRAHALNRQHPFAIRSLYVSLVLYLALSVAVIIVVWRVSFRCAASLFDISRVFSQDGVTPASCVWHLTALVSFNAANIAPTSAWVISPTSHFWAAFIIDLTFDCQSIDRRCVCAGPDEQ